MIEAITFDCYGTLIDWEKGILESLLPMFRAHAIELEEEEILEDYAKIEACLESEPYRPYAEILKAIVSDFGRRLDFHPSARETKALVSSLPRWPPFSDTVGALRRLKKNFPLGIISNTDHALFRGTAKTLGVSFDWIITSEDVKAYKPSSRVFEWALEKIGQPAQKILHVSQSLYHDILPAQKLGFPTVWVNRRGLRKGTGATPRARAKADWEVSDLKALSPMTQIA